MLYRGGVIKLLRARTVARGFFARRRRKFFGDIDCKSLHLGPEIDATHTLLTADICTDYYHDTLAHNDNSNCLATLSTRSLGCMAGIHSALE